MPYRYDFSKVLEREGREWCYRICYEEEQTFLNAGRIPLVGTFWTNEQGQWETHSLPVHYVLMKIMANIGLQEITEKNAEEFYRRCVDMDGVYGHPTPVSEDDIIRCIGLHTNGNRLTKREFARALARRRADEEKIRLARAQNG